LLEGSEQCDLGKAPDGSSKNDGKGGCSPTCQVVPGWTCAADGLTCTKEVYCGDSKVQTTLGEQCDDGVNDGQHGCSSTCTVVTGWKCPPQGGACELDSYCGNGVVDSGEECDDHNLRSADGCSATCFLEAGWSCPPTGGRCARVCGNGQLDSGETCDDGNIYSGDGCSSTCQVESAYSCWVPGLPCVYTPPPAAPQCGNGALEPGESCDDGNVKGGDGCSSTCQLETGWGCAQPGRPCVAAQCGDGILAGSEQCDDGNTRAADGCSPTCTSETGAVCPPSAGACIPMVCGDGRMTGVEQCDDANARDGDGCSSSCQLEIGWKCPLPATQCVPVCGDGLVAGPEQCDEGILGAACCTPSCRLVRGYVCDPSATPHSQPATLYCGNQVVDGPAVPINPIRGSEQCDDGNQLPFDGCSPSCSNEPLCGTLNTYLLNPTPGAYQCFSRCGDGLVMPPEQCDDGNSLNGDGCDSTCKVELIPGTSQPAWTCAQPPPGDTLVLPVVWRDFSVRTHPQFQVEPLVNRRLPGIPQNTLQPVAVGGSRLYQYVPAYNTSFLSPNWGAPFNGNGYVGVAGWTMNGPGFIAGQEGYLQPPWMANTSASYAVDRVWWSNQAGALDPIAAATRYAQWYIDTPTINQSFAGSITLTLQISGAFQYSSTAFFPIDPRGWVATVPAQETARDDGHNYSFTTETRYWFIYQGGERLEFYGDDDLWVFVNGQLTLDLGGVHSRLRGYFQLADDGTATVCEENVPAQGLTANCTTPNLGLVVGQVYEIAVFHAEREVIDSNFQLTLAGFNGAPSVCTPICGDGYVVGSEQCDRGPANVPPSGNTYGNCTTECKLGPYCGDSVLQSPAEACDNGLNLNTYAPTINPASNLCAPGCVPPPRCGDGVIQAAQGEECDNGGQNQDAYGRCQTNCRLGPRCGDSAIQQQYGEQCDQGANNGALSSPCAADCRLKCGNGVVDPGEKCDSGSGTNGNGSLASPCGANCQWKCGNGQLDPGEACDDGKNDGSYGTCRPDCKLAPYCGDNEVQDPEVCDLGPNNRPDAYGLTSCTNQCLPGPWCGDGMVNGPEKCDDGKNTGLPGSCTPECDGYVPSSECGDGVIQLPEQCDDGPSNGAQTSDCDSTCRFKCGNAVIDPGEQCDNGVNDGSYGTCRADCTLADFCGDGVKNGQEQCDRGPNNVPPASAYGADVCTTICTFAPFCGDGRVQSQFGEQCEGNVACERCMTVTLVL
jgi:fibro-slime domain-containing protein